ncbi:MAG: glycosyltransferase family 2 protein, partial [Candidatus Thorarchaeota archaeon]
MILSVAMIVRDESNNLARCLESIKKFNAQIVILDTGSVDDTVEIAKRYTNEVYFQKWQDNYSLHRNKSFSYCKG